MSKEKFRGYYTPDYKPDPNALPLELQYNVTSGDLRKLYEQGRLQDLVKDIGTLYEAASITCTHEHRPVEGAEHLTKSVALLSQIVKGIQTYVPEMLEETEFHDEISLMHKYFPNVGDTYFPELDALKKDEVLPPAAPQEAPNERARMGRFLKRDDPYIVRKDWLNAAFLEFCTEKNYQHLPDGLRTEGLAPNMEYLAATVNRLREAFDVPEFHPPAPEQLRAAQPAPQEFFRQNHEAILELCKTAAKMAATLPANDISTLKSAATTLFQGLSELPDEEHALAFAQVNKVAEYEDYPRDYFGLRLNGTPDKNAGSPTFGEIKHALQTLSDTQYYQSGAFAPTLHASAKNLAAKLESALSAMPETPDTQVRERDDEHAPYRPHRGIPTMQHIHPDYVLSNQNAIPRRGGMGAS